MATSKYPIEKDVFKYRGRIDYQSYTSSTFPTAPAGVYETGNISFMNIEKYSWLYKPLANSLDGSYVISTYIKKVQQYSSAQNQFIDVTS